MLLINDHSLTLMQNLRISNESESEENQGIILSDHYDKLNDIATLVVYICQLKLGDCII